MASVSDCDDATLVAACGRRALEAGSLYQAQGRVTELSVSDDGREVEARVRGSERQPYRQVIAINGQKPGRIGIDGECSCPVGHNCKHVAAVLVAARGLRPKQGTGAGLARSQTSSDQPRPVMVGPATPLAARPHVPALPSDLAAWLNGLDAAAAAGSEDYPDEVRHRLIYLLVGQTQGDRHPALALQPMKARLRKDGSFGDVRPFDAYRGAATPLKFVRPSDLIILARLVHQRHGYGGQPTYALADRTGADLLTALLATGRLRWQTIDGCILSQGPERLGSITWRLGNDARHRPVIEIAGVEGADAAGLIVLNATPPIWIDSASGLVGPVQIGIADMLAHAVLSAPPVAPGDAPRVAEILQSKGASLAALAPPPPRIDDIVAGPPVPILRLEATTAPMEPPAGRPRPYGWDWHPPTRTVGVGRVAFSYEGLELGAGDKRSQPVLARRGGLVRVERDRAAEAGRMAELAAADLHPVAEARSGAAGKQGTALIPADGEPGWLDFLWHGKPRLEAMGWRIVVAQDFPVRLAVPEDGLQARLGESSGIDWLELDLGVTLEGASFDLLPVLIELILSPDFETTLAALERPAAEEPFFLPLPDGRVLGLPAEAMQPILATLAALLLHRKDGRPRLSPADAEALDALERAGVAFTGGERLRALGRRLAQAGGIPEIAPPPWFTAELRPYQARGLAWLQLLAEAGLGGILADDMGLGKTVQTLAHLAVEKEAGRLDRPALIVAPTSLIGNWAHEAARFAPGLSVLVLHGLDRRSDFHRIAAADLVVTTYPLIARDQAILAARDWHVLVLDEAQALKNPDATTTKIVARLSARQRLCLSGTPLENHLGELWSLFSIVNPGFLGDRKSFSRVYRTPIEKKGDGERARLLARRVRPFMLRRTKAEVAPELPAKTEMTEPVELGTAQRAVYETIRLAMHDKVRAVIATRGFGQSRIVILDALLKLRQAACDPRLLEHGRGEAGKAGSAKLDRLMEMLDELLAEGRRVLVFSQFTSMLALIEERLRGRDIPYALLTGESRDRPAIIARFQEGAVPIFLVSLKAGGVGLNLTTADTVILYDPWWNPAVEDQAVDRAHRIGQDKPVFVHRLVAQDTIEQKMELLKERKRALSAGLFDADGVPTLAMTEADIEQLLG